MPLGTDELIEKAKTQRAQKRYAEALVSALAATASSPRSTEAWWQVALCRLAVADSKNAIIALRKTVELEPGANAALAKLGQLLLEEGQLDEAKDVLRDALEIDEDDLNALETLSKVLFKANVASQDDEELSVLQTIEGLSYLDPWQLQRCGNLHYRSGRYFDAIAYWRRDIDESASASSRYNLGLAYSRPEISQDADAIDMWRLALAEEPAYELAKKKLTSHLPKML